MEKGTKYINVTTNIKVVAYPELGGMGKIGERLKDSVVFTEEGVLLFICSYFNQGHILTGVDSLMDVI